jgi:hypothetical protein
MSAQLGKPLLKQKNRNITRKDGVLNVLNKDISPGTVL